MASDAGERHDLVVEAALGLGPQRALVGFDGERLHLVAGDVPLVDHHLGADELAHVTRPVDGLPTRRAAVGIEPFILPEGERGGDRHLRHVLHAAGDDDVHRAGHDGLGREVHRLLSRAALTVDGDTGDVLGEPADQRTGASDVAGLGSDRVEASEHDVVDRVRIDARAFHQRTDRMAAQVGRVDLGKATATSADG